MCGVMGCENPILVQCRQLCRAHYRRWQRHGNPLGGEGFWTHVVFTSTCWFWNGSIDPEGYGKWASTVAHRAAYIERVGSIPPNLHLDHLCRVRSCVNPDHLEPVTPAENDRRAIKARGVNGRYVGVR